MYHSDSISFPRSKNEDIRTLLRFVYKTVFALSFIEVRMSLNLDNQDSSKFAAVKFVKPETSSHFSLHR